MNQSIENVFRPMFCGLCHWPNKHWSTQELTKNATLCGWLRKCLSFFVSFEIYPYDFFLSPKCQGRKCLTILFVIPDSRSVLFYFTRHTFSFFFQSWRVRASCLLFSFILKCSRFISRFAICAFFFFPEKLARIAKRKYNAGFYFNHLLIPKCH